MENAVLSLNQRVKISLDKAVENGYDWVVAADPTKIAFELEGFGYEFGNQSMRVLRVSIKTWQEEKKNEI